MRPEIDTARLMKVGEVYTPAYPVEIENLFSGRKAQLARAFSIIPQKGQHAIIFGDRGVGKTSFSNILKVLLTNSNQLVNKISCTSDDTFSSLWKNIFLGFNLKTEKIYEKPSFRKDTEIIEGTVNLMELLQSQEINTTKILELLRYIGSAIIIIDEFDRLDDDCFNKKLFTDTVKAISDSLPNITIIIVGVSEDISNLITEHESIERNLGQIHMPIMSADEIREIVKNGESPLKIKFDVQVVEKIIQLSSGYPHFAHSLCYHSAYTGILDGGESINELHLQLAIKQTIDNTHESLRNSYRIATLATKENIFSEVLFAASISPTDEYGYFQAKDLEPILTEKLVRDIKVTNFVSHLSKFCTTERGEILRVTGTKNRQRYKFKNPLMRAFIRLKMENKRLIE